jgi:hypothetical protein
MTRAEWAKEIRKLPKGLGYQAAADYLGQSYHRTRFWMLKLGYRCSIRRKQGHFWRRQETAAIYDLIDWSLSNIEIAKRLPVNPMTGRPRSRERIRQLRNEFGKPKVEARGRKKKVVGNCV